MQRKIAFITGQGGAGKTTLVRYFEKHPVKNWYIFDFDEGAVNKPDTKHLNILSGWVDKQREYWIKEVLSPKYGNKNICVFNVGLFPWKVGDIKNVSFAYLSLNQEERKRRLINRGDPHLWEAYNKDVSNIVKRLDEAGAVKFDCDNKTTDEIADEIKNWLISLLKN